MLFLLILIFLSVALFNTSCWRPKQFRHVKFLVIRESQLLNLVCCVLMWKHFTMFYIDLITRKKYVMFNCFLSNACLVVHCFWLVRFLLIWLGYCSQERLLIHSMAVTLPPFCPASPLGVKY